MAFSRQRLLKLSFLVIRWIRISLFSSRAASQGHARTLSSNKPLSQEMPRYPRAKSVTSRAAAKPASPRWSRPPLHPLSGRGMQKAPSQQWARGLRKQVLAAALSFRRTKAHAYDAPMRPGSGLSTGGNTRPIIPGCSRWPCRQGSASSGSGTTRSRRCVQVNDCLGWVRGCMQKALRQDTTRRRGPGRKKICTGWGSGLAVLSRRHTRPITAGLFLPGRIQAPMSTRNN